MTLPPNARPAYKFFIERFLTIMVSLLVSAGIILLMKSIVSDGKDIIFANDDSAKLIFAAFVGLFLIFIGVKKGELYELAAFSFYFVDNVFMRFASSVAGLSEQGASTDRIKTSRLPHLAAMLAILVISGLAYLLAYLLVTAKFHIAQIVYSLALAALIFIYLILISVMIGICSSRGSWQWVGNLISYERPERYKNNGNPFRIYHLSDMHITRGTDVATTENEKSFVKDKVLQKIIKLIEVADKNGPSTPIIITGDITDTGDAVEWERFWYFFSPYRKRLVIVPGNHDINIVGYGEASLRKVADERHFRGRIIRLENYFKAVACLPSASVRCLSLDEGQSPLLVPLQEELNTIMLEKARGRSYFQKLCGIFPLIFEINQLDSNGLKIMVVGWNSVKTSNLALFNTQGAVSANQIKSFKLITAALDSRYGCGAYNIIHAIHHKITMPKDIKYFTDLPPKKHRIQVASMVLENAAELVSTLTPKNKFTVLLHGHHHVRFHGSIGHDGCKIDLVSAPSSTLPCEGAVPNDKVKTPGFEIIDILLSKEGARIANKGRNWMTSRSRRK